MLFIFFLIQMFWSDKKKCALFAALLKKILWDRNLDSNSPQIK